MTYEIAADPVTPPRHPFDLPIEKVRPSLKGTPGNDGDRGFHEWRQLLAATSTPRYACWQPLKRVPSLPTIECGFALPPKREYPRHDPVHEKTRWDTIRALDQKDALSYGYRKHIPGYKGHTFTTEHIHNPIERDVENCNRAMVTTNQSFNKKYPVEFSRHRRQPNVTSDCQFCHGSDELCLAPLPPLGPCFARQPTPCDPYGEGLC